MSRNLILILVMVSLGCYDPAATKTDVGGGEAEAELTVESQSTDLEFSLDADNTDVKWTGSNAAGQTPYGYFYELNGKAIVDSTSMKIKHLEMVMEMDSVKATNETLTEKLKMSGFFEVEKYPQSRFVTTTVDGAIPQTSPDGTNQILQGNFQLRDTTKSISIPVQVSASKQSLKLSSEFKLNRKDYGVIYSDAAGDALIRDNVVINLDIEVDK